VVWLPGKRVHNLEGQPLAGEVKGNTVYIYDESDPVFTLKHEFFEFLLNQDKKPLLDLLAKLLAQIAYEQYKRSERLADVLAKHF
jgi:Zn-dependent peptidase ImmA (M78 family)